jgi:hypothetical protein
METFRYRFTQGRTGAVLEGRVEALDERDARRIVLDGKDGRSWKGWVVQVVPEVEPDLVSPRAEVARLESELTACRENAEMLRGMLRARTARLEAVSQSVCGEAVVRGDGAGFFCWKPRGHDGPHTVVSYDESQQSTCSS